MRTVSEENFAPRLTWLGPPKRPPALSDRGLGVALAGDAEAVEDGARGVGAVEGVEVNSGDVVVQEIVALFEGEVHADAADQLVPPEAFVRLELSLQNHKPSV